MKARAAEKAAEALLARALRLTYADGVAAFETEMPRLLAMTETSQERLQIRRSVALMRFVLAVSSNRWAEIDAASLKVDRLRWASDRYETYVRYALLYSGWCVRQGAHLRKARDKLIQARARVIRLPRSHPLKGNLATLLDTGLREIPGRRATSRTSRSSLPSRRS